MSDFCLLLTFWVTWIVRCFDGDRLRRTVCRPCDLTRPWRLSHDSFLTWAAKYDPSMRYANPSRYIMTDALMMYAVSCVVSRGVLWWGGRGAGVTHTLYVCCAALVLCVRGRETDCVCVLC